MNQTKSEELPRDEQIETFLNSHRTKSQLHDVSVKDMRHFIPLFLMEVYSQKYGHYTKKVKGLWEKRPDDWPVDTPFVDPNNKLKDEVGKNLKPKKELLGQMLTHLIKRHKEKRGSGPVFMPAPARHIPSYPDLSEDLVSLEPDDPSFGLTTDYSLDHHQMASEYFSQSSAATSGAYSSVDPASFGLDLMCLFDDDSNQLFGGLLGQMEPTNPPEQAMDNEDANVGEDWDPVVELNQRILQKLRFMKRRKFFLEFADFQSMEGRYNELKEASVDPADCFSVIDGLHALEKDIDNLRFSGRTSIDKFSEITPYKSSEFSMKRDESENEIVSKFADDVDPCTEPQLEVPIPVEDPVLMTSLNIKTRHGGPQPSGTVGGNLSLRSMPGPDEAQNEGALKASTLSESWKPIRPVEDGNQTVEEIFQNLFAPESETMSPIEDNMSVLKISDSHEAHVRNFTPVQETDGACRVVSNAGKVNAISAVGRASTPLQLIYSGVGGQGIEVGNAVSLASTGALNSFTIPAELFHLLIQRSSSALTSTAPPPPPVIAERKQFSTGLQPQSANTRKQVKPGGKRGYPDDDDDVEMKASPDLNLSVLNSESSCGSLIPTVVEEMSDSLASSTSRFSKKSRRTT